MTPYPNNPYRVMADTNPTGRDLFNAWEEGYRSALIDIEQGHARIGARLAEAHPDKGFDEPTRGHHPGFPCAACEGMITVTETDDEVIWTCPCGKTSGTQFHEKEGE